MALTILPNLHHVPRFYLISGKRWGGVVATGGAVGLSWDRGGAHGVWAVLSAHELTGKNVADN
ncbi:hypothetical protein BBW68_07940 [Candidatus Erwinia dacicola]|uniref:Cellulose synthase operon C family protein n=1 Tax=Candidatus Erwinia dacicola TaxID=252393 RepID=A0A1E7Z252_9GAMM|nr:hypothetical protein BBW68_07940 [Candidatus Erwinia dacicola]RAP70568.1 cellulose synthase operon C family protein [Candidatus Erwinia dacicola]